MSSSNILSYSNRGVIIGGTYIISDLHLGYSDEIPSMTQQDERIEIADRITATLENEDIESIVLNGDIFHQFKRPSDKAREIFNELKLRVQADDINLFVISGNHDKVAKEQFSSTIDFKSYHKFKHQNTEVVVTHGHKMVEAGGADLFIFGHLHPVMKVSGVNWPSYLFGEEIYDSSDVLILPCYSEYQDGVVISKRTKIDIKFPYIGVSDFARMRPIIYDDNKDDVKKFPILEKSDSYFGL